MYSRGYKDLSKLNAGIVVNERRVDLVKEYIESSNDYSIEEYLKSIGQYDDSKIQEQSDNYFISCPFHSDSSPSLSINRNRNIFKCFGCGRGGGYVAMVREWESYNGRKIDDKDIIESLLKSDKVMANSLGFVTIYERQIRKKDFSKFSLTRPERNLLKDYEPDTYKALASRLKKDKRSIHDKVNMVAFMQAGMDAKEAYRILYDKNKRVAEIDMISKDGVVQLSKDDFNIDDILAIK